MKTILLALLMIVMLIATPLHAQDLDRAKAHEAWIAKCYADAPADGLQAGIDVRSRYFFKCMADEPHQHDHDADWKPYATLMYGQLFDAVTTLRSTPNCIESNPLLGPHPSARQVLVPKLAIIGGISLLVRFTEYRESRLARIVARSIAYAGGIVGTKDGIHNLRTCGW